MIIRLSFILATLIALCQIAEGSSVGRTAGQFGVSRVGSAQYNIPIWAPPGPRGIQPNVSLSYNSQSTIGPLGIGWSLGGLGAITRCNLTTAQDTTPAPVALVTTDGYCINGNRLRLTSGTYGTAGSTYQTEVADFSNITAYGKTGFTGIAYFMVQGRNGLTYYYGFVDGNGNGANSQALATGTTTVLTWYLSKVMDRSNTNNYVINYVAPTTTPPNSLTGTTVPSNIMWTPVSAGATTYAYTMQFNYGTNVPQSSIYRYVAGTVVSNNQLLTSIEILSGSTVVKDYFLAYQASPLTGRKELITVTECADSGESNCLSPTTVGYQGGTPGLSTTPNSEFSGQAVGVSARYDLNGDGYPDLVYDGPSGWVVQFGSASGYGAPVSLPNGAYLFGNLTGGKEDGYLTIVSNVWWYYTWNGSAFVGTSTGLAYDSTALQYQLADVNGDGLSDLVSIYVTGPNNLGHYNYTVYTRLSTSSGGTPSFSATLNTAYTAGNIAEAQLQTPDMQYGKLRRYDFNGDGRDDLVLQVVTGKSPSYTISTYELISTGTTFTGTLIESASASTYASVYFTNWNDDKCTDFVTLGKLYISGCNGTTATNYSLTGTIVGAIDWDGDGRTDILVANGSTIGVYLSQGTGAPTLTTTSFPYSSNCVYVWMDANGDGLDDLGCWNQASPYGLTYYLHNGTSDLATSFADGFGNSASPTYLPLSETSYSTSGYTATFPDAVYSGPMYVVTKATFSDPSSSTGATYNQSYSYFPATQNLQGRGFNGFSEISALDSRNNLYDNRYYELAFPYTGMKYQDNVLDGSIYPKKALGTPALNTLSTTTNQERYFPYFSNWTISRWEVGGTENGDEISTTSINYTYDNYGNALTIVKTITDNDPGSPYNGDAWTTSTTNTPDIAGTNQSADLAAWCLNMVDVTQVIYTSTLAGSTSVTRTKTFMPDTPANCRIVSSITEPTANSGLYKVTEALTFDNFGNIATDTVTGANMPSSPTSRETQLNWGTTGQFLNSSIDPAGATTTMTYTSSQSLTFGVPDSRKDANNLTTSWLYDPFGRKTKETRPDGTSTAWTWTACTSYCGWSNSAYQIAQSAYQTNGSTIIRTDTNYYDPIDRVTEISGPTVAGSIGIVQKLYNSLGLLTQQSMPFLSGGTVYEQTYAYDVLNRLTTATRPISSTNSSPQSTSYAYAGRKLTVTDPLGHTKTTITDVNKWLRQTQDGLGYKITRAFDAAGSLIGVTDSVGNTLLSGVTVVYGLKPFRVAATDADLGAWSYTVDSLGERTGWTDAKGQSFSETFDALSRPLTRTEPDLFTQWTWGSTAASHNVGQLIAECTGTGSACSSSAYSESRTFDSNGRPYQRSITESGVVGNDPGGVFLITYAYSATTGLPSSLTYPISTSGVALNLQYAYQYGLLQSVTDTTDTTATCGSTCTLWTANAMNSFGQVTQETLGNGVVTNRSFDAVTSWLSTATAGVGGGATLLNQSYAEDEDGNIIERQNNNLGLTENFFYDADNRLTCATLTSSCSTPTFVYDGGVAGPGNITTQVGVGTYTYPTAGQPRPHAVSSITGTFNGITNPSFSYDANGNMTDRASSSANVTWSSYNYPTAISASDVTGSEEVQLTYGPDRQRWKQIYTIPGTTETTYYVGGLVDLVFIGGIANYRHYIYAGGEPVAVYTRNASGGITMSYMLEDHQGGVASIASNSGAADVNESFSAFGQRRNPTSWSGAPSTADLNTIAGLSRQGYTFQTWLGQSMGLNHMNGRVQDAILGRFLSPDPHVPHPGSAQSYNRYSYANNNPLTFVDPTGFDDCPGLTDGDDCGSGPGTTTGSIATAPSGGGADLTGSRGIGFVDCGGNCPQYYYSTTPGPGPGGVNITGSNLNLNYVSPATTAWGDPTQFDPTAAVDQWLANNMPNAFSAGSGSPIDSGFSLETSLTAANYSLMAAGFGANSMVESTAAQIASDAAWSMRPGLTVDIGTHYEAEALSFLGSEVIRYTGFAAVGIDATQTFISIWGNDPNYWAAAGHGFSTALDAFTVFNPLAAPITIPTVIFIDTLPIQMQVQGAISESIYNVYMQTGVVPTVP
jgi:RHS repeat-associated protein